MANKNTYPKTFRPPTLLRLFASIPFLMFTFIFAFTLASIISAPISFDVSSVIGISLVLVIYYILFSAWWSCAEYIMNFAIIVTPDGLWFHGYGKRFYTWDTMLHLSTNDIWSRKQTGWGIKTGESQIVYHNVIAKWLVGSWIYNNFIPIEGVVRVPRRLLVFHDKDKFIETELGQELFHFAPHLFEDDMKHKRKNRLHDTDDYDYDIVTNEGYQDMSR